MYSITIYYGSHSGNFNTFLDKAEDLGKIYFIFSSRKELSYVAMQYTRIMSKAHVIYLEEHSPSNILNIIKEKPHPVFVDNYSFLCNEKGITPSFLKSVSEAAPVYVCLSQTTPTSIEALKKLYSFDNTTVVMFPQTIPAAQMLKEYGFIDEKREQYLISHFDDYGEMYRMNHLISGDLEE